MRDMTTATAPLSASAPVTINSDPARPVRLWLWIVAGLVLVMVTVGGATRLTGSGLSITEWRPVTGAIPPLNAADWASEFDKYRQIPQYQLLNKGMSLAEFKFIYWWEWGHRQLGRFIGALYLGGFLWFAAKRTLPVATTLTLFVMGLLLATQGAIGWVMVASGLREGMVAVAPIKLTLHLTLASLFLASVVAMATRLSPPKPGNQVLGARGLLAGAVLLLLLVFVQIALGGLVAGSKAGLTYNTWPLMDGALIPPASVLFVGTPWFANFADNVALVQFNHRIMAYLLAALVLWHWWQARRIGGSPAKRGNALMGLTIAQIVLGIVTLLLAVPLWAGLAHQALAMLLLVMAVVHVVRLAQAPATFAKPHASA
ncbi:MAG: COX15/CtaA family protein [Bosea sp. (in: a-proteobacteria)]